MSLPSCFANQRQLFPTLLCKRFLLSTSAFKHKQKCQSENQSDKKPKSGKLKPDNTDINQKFHRNILSHIRTNNDPVGTLATSDHGIILLIGKNLYRGTDDQKRSNITNPMRLLARLLLICRQIEGNNEGKRANPKQKSTIK